MAYCKKIFLVFVFSLFVFTTNVFAEWNGNDINALTSQINSLIEQNNNMISWLTTINSTLAGDLGSDLESIKNNLNTLSHNYDELVAIKNQLTALNNNITTIMNSLTGGQYSYSFKLSGSTYCESVPDLDTISSNGSVKLLQPGAINAGFKKIDYNFLKGVTYKFTFNKTGSNSSSTKIFYTTDNCSFGATVNVIYLGNFTADNLNFSITPTENCTITLLVKNAGAVSGSNGTFNISGSSSGALDKIQGAITESGDKINNSITDDNVNVESSLPSNDTNDVTMEGFNSIFNTIKNAFTGSTSNDIVLSIPFTDKSITINYNNVFGSFSFGILSNIINAFWFFVVSLFIVNDIRHKIHMIQSGNIENLEDTNIKGDLL